MSTFILVLFFHVGYWGKTDSNAATNVPGFISEQECNAAGNQASALVAGTKKEVVFICVKQTKEFN